MIIISDISPITNLAAIGKLDLLHLLYASITIPVAVYNELTQALLSHKPGFLVLAGGQETGFPH